MTVDNNLVPRTFPLQIGISKGNVQRTRMLSNFECLDSSRLSKGNFFNEFRIILTFFKHSILCLEGRFGLYWWNVKFWYFIHNPTVFRLVCLLGKINVFFSPFACFGKPLFILVFIAWTQSKITSFILEKKTIQKKHAQENCRCGARKSFNHCLNTFDGSIYN